MNLKIRAALLFAGCLAVASAQVSPFLPTLTLQDENFESFTPGAGQLAPPLSIYPFGSAYISGNPGADPISGVVGTSVLGTGQAAYLGGVGTNLQFTDGLGNFGVEVFTGSSTTPPVQVIGSPRPVITGERDFAYERNGNDNQESFVFFVYDAQFATPGGFDLHSLVLVNPGGRVVLQDNSHAPYFQTDIWLTDNTPYHLSVIVDYNTATWSALVTDRTTGRSYLLADNRSINDPNYTLSGWTTPGDGWFDAELYAEAVSNTQKGFIGRMVFDNFRVSATSAPFTDSLDTATNWAFDSGQTYGDGGFEVQNGRLEYLAASPTANDQIQAMPVPGAQATEMTYGPGASHALVGPADSDWSAQVTVHNTSPALTPGQRTHAVLGVYNLQDAHFDNGLHLGLDDAADAAGNVQHQVVNYTWGNALSQVTATDTADATFLVRYESISHTLTASYSVDGTNWLPLVSFVVTKANADGGWGMAPAPGAAFGLSLFCSSTTANPDGIGPIVNPGDVYFTHFTTSGLVLGNWPQYVPLDSTPPVLTLPADISVEATSPAGAVVTFAASAADAVDGAVPVTYDHAPGSIFPIGTTTVTVRATDAAGNVAVGSFSVTVPAPTGRPTIVTEPQDATVVMGQTLSLAVVAHGAFPLSYQWRKGGVDVAGATSAVLTIPNVQPEDAGNYRVKVTNSRGTVSSAAAHVTDVQPVIITEQPVGDTIMAGKNITFKVQAGGTGPLSYQWRKDGSDVPGATDKKLQLTSVRTADAGSYQVVVSNAAGSVPSAFARLVVVEKPTVTTGPADLTISAGQTASLTVTATGTGPLSYQWRKGGVDIPGATAATLVIPNAQRADTGNYKVVVTNLAGSDTSPAARLTVR